MSRAQSFFFDFDFVSPLELAALLSEEDPLEEPESGFVDVSDFGLSPPPSALPDRSSSRLRRFVP